MSDSSDNDGEYQEESSSYFSKKTGVTHITGVTQMIKGGKNTEKAFKMQEDKLKKELNIKSL